MVKIVSSAITLLQLIVFLYIPSTTGVICSKLSSRHQKTLHTPDWEARQSGNPATHRIFTDTTYFGIVNSFGNAFDNYYSCSVANRCLIAEQLTPHSAWYDHSAVSAGVSCAHVDDANINIKCSSSSAASNGEKTEELIRCRSRSATRACATQRPVRRGCSVSRLYSSASDYAVYPNENICAPQSLQDEQPITLFHSVICGSSGSVSSSSSAYSSDNEEIIAHKKAPIVVLHGLLGSARNFQSWMKLVQQREVELDKEEDDKRKLEVSRQANHFNWTLKYN